MKSIFVFDDSRPTDDLRTVMALGEDGQRVARIQFDSFTFPHSEFAMGTRHYIDCDDAEVRTLVLSARASVIAQYGAVYGARDWMPLWLDDPHSNVDWRAAMSRCRMREANSSARRVPPFSDRALAGILGAVFDATDALPHTTH